MRFVWNFIYNLRAKEVESLLIWDLINALCQVIIRMTLEGQMPFVGG